MGEMSPLLREAFERVAELPKQVQDRIASYLLEIDEDGRYRLSAEENSAIDEGLRQAEAGEFVADDEISARLARLGL